MRVAQARGPGPQEPPLLTPAPGAGVEAGWRRENSMWTLFLYCFPQNRTGAMLSRLHPGGSASWSAPSEGRTSPASCFLSRFPQTPAQGNAGSAGRHGRPRSLEPSLSGRGSRFSLLSPPGGPGSPGAVHSPGVAGSLAVLSRGSLHPASLEQEGAGQGTCWEMMRLLLSIGPLGSRRRWKGWEE